MTKLAAAALALGTLAASPHVLGQARSAAPALPAPVGPLAVGRIDYHWIDVSRPEPQSAQNSARRELMVHVWYPAVPSKGVGPRAPYFGDFTSVKKVVSREALEALFRPAPYSMIELAGLPETHAVESAEMPKVTAKYPVLVFSHGLGNPSSLYTAALEDLASHGYVVAAIDHTYDSAFTIFPGGRVVTYARDAWSAETQKLGGYVLRKEANRRNVGTGHPIRHYAIESLRPDSIPQGTVCRPARSPASWCNGTFDGRLGGRAGLSTGFAHHSLHESGCQYRRFSLRAKLSRRTVEQASSLLHGSDCECLQG